MSRRDPYDLNKRLLENWRAHNEIPTLDELLGFGKNKSSGEPTEEYPAGEFARLYRVIDDANTRLELNLDREELYAELQKLITSQNFSIQEQDGYITGNQLEYAIGNTGYPLLAKLFKNAGQYLGQLQKAFETAGIKVKGKVGDISSVDAPVGPPRVKPEPTPVDVEEVPDDAVEDELRPQANPDAWTGPGPVDLVVSPDDAEEVPAEEPESAKADTGIRYSLPNNFQYKLSDRSKFVYGELEKIYARKYQNKSLRKDLIALVRILGPYAATMETTKIAESNRAGRLLKMIAKNSGGSDEGVAKSLGALKAAHKSGAIQRLAKAMLSYKGRPGHKVGGDLKSFIGDLMLNAKAVDVSGRRSKKRTDTKPAPDGFDPRIPHHLQTSRYINTGTNEPAERPKWPNRKKRAAERVMRDRFKTIAGIK